MLSRAAAHRFPSLGSARNASALRQRHPEWWVGLFIAVVWLTLVLSHGWGSPTPSVAGSGSSLVGRETVIHAAHFQPFAAALPAGGHGREARTLANSQGTHLHSAGAGRAIVDWTVMAVAMMMPVTLPAVRYVALNSLRARRLRAMLVYLSAFVAVWVTIGVMGLVALHWVGQDLGISLPLVDTPAPGGSLVLPAALAIAGAWQASRWKRRALNACMRVVPLRPVGWRADASCASYGTQQGWRCFRSCWALMMVMIVAGSATLAWMIGLTLIVVAEELSPTGRRFLRPSAAGLTLLALVVLAAGQIASNL